MLGHDSCLLRVGNKGADVTKSSNEEGNRLKEEENVVSVLSKGKIIASTEEEIGSSTKF
jgi:hypothetical protein